MKIQPPKCLGIPMREPTKIQLQAPPIHQWELRLPGLPFEVHVCDSGRWVITSGRDSVAYGNEGERDRAAAKAGETLRDWAVGIMKLDELVKHPLIIVDMTTQKPEPVKPFEHPMAAKAESTPTVIREPASSTTSKRK